MKHIHRVLKPFLTADLLSRHPGEFASHDHTFRIANRTLGDATAYSFMLGENHTIFWHGAVRTTSWDELVPALKALQRRFERLGVSGMLKYWYDDLCCSGKVESKLHEHVVVDIFPGVDRCPRKDGFHAVQLVTQTFNAGTGEVDVRARDVGATLRPIHEPDLKKATQHLMKSEGLAEMEARREAQKRYRGTGILRTYGPQPKQLLPAWEQLIDRMRSDREAKGSSSYVRTEYGPLKGTIEQCQSMRACIQKGCYSDPVTKVKRMYIATRAHSDCKQLHYRVKKSESVKNETVHKGANRLVQDISRMGEDMLDIRIDFFVLLHNLKADAREGSIDGISLGLPHQQLFIHKSALSLLESSPFPLAASRSAHAGDGGISESSDQYEHHGFGYWRHVAELERNARAEEARSRLAVDSGSGLPLAHAAAPKKSAGKRATKARKGKTQNLLNNTPVKPSTPHEVELMLKVVAQADMPQAKKARGNRKLSVWDIASNLYREAFHQNCALPAGERLLIRSSTTAEYLEQSYQDMAKEHRSFLAHAEQTAMIAAPGDAGASTDAPGARAGEESAGNCEGGGGGNAEGEAKARAPKGRAKWRVEIEGGRALSLSDVNTLGIKPLTAFLRAMGETVKRDDARSVERLRELARNALRDRGLSVWTVEIGKGVQAGVQGDAV